FMAQGYVHAQDRFWEMDFRRHTTAGRLSELFGESQVGTDTFIRTLGWRETAEKELDLLDPVTLSYYQAYADGVNAYLGSHSGADLSLEYAVLDLQNPGYVPEKWTPADSVSWLKAMAWDLRSNIEDEIDRALLSVQLPAEQVAELHPAYPYAAHPTIVPGAATAATDAQPLPDAAVSTAALEPLEQLHATLAGLPEMLGEPGSDIGSNSWAVSGALTDTGLPILANDPHLGASMPSVWHQMGLRCETVGPECPFDVAGFGFAGVPGIIIGHNARIAWGFTNLGPDVADLYLEKISDGNYEMDGAQVALATRRETIEVAGGDPVEITIRSTERGPIVTDITDDFGEIAAGYPAAAGLPEGEYALSLQWTALTPGHTPSSIFLLDTATTWDEFRGAAAMFDVPAQNLLYADVDGNIGYQAPGLVPIRRSGDGTVPLPGWTSATGWSGYVPFGSLPTLLNPSSGYIVTANNAVTESSSPMLTKDWDQGYRAQEITARLQQEIAEARPITTKTMSEIQSDTHNAMGARLAPVIAELDLDGDAAKGAALLADWDYADDADSAGSAYFNMVWRNLLTGMFGEKLSDETSPRGGARWFSVVGALLDTPESPWWTNESLGVSGRDEMLAWAAQAAWTEGVDTLGADPSRWRWDALHALELTNQTFGVSGIGPIEWLFNRGPYPVGGGSSVVDAVGWNARLDTYDVTNVPSMRLVVSLADWDDATWVNLTGNSGHAFHPNYADQAPLWQTHETRPWPFSLDAVQDAAKDTLVLKAG
ncbi:MAG: penicillin acylase family protein, partial [Leifsonia sp.]